MVDSTVVNVRGPGSAAHSSDENLELANHVHVDHLKTICEILCLSLPMGSYFSTVRCPGLVSCTLASPHHGIASTLDLHA